MAGGRGLPYSGRAASGCRTVILSEHDRVRSVLCLSLFVSLVCGQQRLQDQFSRGVGPAPSWRAEIAIQGGPQA